MTRALPLWRTLSQNYSKMITDSIILNWESSKHWQIWKCCQNAIHCNVCKMCWMYLWCCAQAIMTIINSSKQYSHFSDHITSPMHSHRPNNFSRTKVCHTIEGMSDNFKVKNHHGIFWSFFMPQVHTPIKNLCCLRLIKPKGLQSIQSVFFCGINAHLKKTSKKESFPYYK